MTSIPFLFVNDGSGNPSPPNIEPPGSSQYFFCYYSGGGNNRRGELSLGGANSNFLIPFQPLNNLLNNVPPIEALEGETDYRCIYVFNNHQEKELTNVTVNMSGILSADSMPSYGWENPTNEVQKLIVVGNPDADEDEPYFVLDTTFGAPFKVFSILENVNAWASDFQTILRTTPHFATCTVTGSQVGSIRTFTITYLGEVGNRAMPLISLVRNQLSSSGNSLIQIKRITTGSPINILAQTIPDQVTAPEDVSFGTGTLDVGLLQAGDHFPLWIKRDTPGALNNGILAGFSLNFSGDVV